MDMEEQLMPRSEARVFASIWSDPGWRARTPEEQWTYMMLLSQGDLAQDGVISLRESRWARLADGVSVADMQKWLSGLADSGWIVIDDLTGELLVRSLIRHDRVFMQPNVMRAALAHLTTVESSDIRRVIYSELMRIIAENTDEARAERGEKALTSEQKAVITRGVSVLRSSGDAFDPEGSPDASGNPSGNPSGKGSGKGSEEGSANPLGDRGKGLGVRDLGFTRAHTREEATLFGPVVEAAEGSPAHRGQLAVFDDFWKIYPRKAGKEAARKAWASAIKKADVQDIISGARRYAADPNREAEYTAHPSTWLNQGRWEDEALPVRTGGRATSAASARAERIAAFARGGPIGPGRHEIGGADPFALDGTWTEVR